MSRIDPTSQAIGDITRITMRSDTRLQLPTSVNATTVIESGRPVVRDCRTTASIVDSLTQSTGKAITTARTTSSIAYHLGDGVLGAWVRHAVLIACGGAVVVLHETWVAHTVVGSRGADTAAGLLHDNGEDEAMVDFGFGSNLLDRVVDRANLWARIIGLAELRAGATHLSLVVVEPGSWC